MVGDGKKWKEFVDGIDTVTDNNSTISIKNVFRVEIDGVFRGESKAQNAKKQYYSNLHFQ